MITHYDSFDEMWSVINKKLEAITPVKADNLDEIEGMTKYRLNEVINVPTTFYIQQTSGTGRIKWGSLRLDPGVVYESSDERLIGSLMQRSYMKVAYNEKLEARLKELGKEYDVEICKSCGGRVKKIRYHAVEIV